MKFILVIVFLFIAGCPLDGGSTGPVEECTKAAEQCRMQEGQLGVCSMTMEGELVCMPQH